MLLSHSAPAEQQRVKITNYRVDQRKQLKIIAHRNHKPKIIRKNKFQPEYRGETGRKRMLIRLTNLKITFKEPLLIKQNVS